MVVGAKLAFNHTSRLSTYISVNACRTSNKYYYGKGIRYSLLLVVPCAEPVNR